MLPPLSNDGSAIRSSRADALPGKERTSSIALAAYIADMTGELAKLAGDAELPMLCYFLNLARVEADLQARGVAVPRGKI